MYVLLFGSLKRNFDQVILIYYIAYKNQKQNMATSKYQINEGLYNEDLWDRFDFHLGSYVKSPLQLRYVSSKTSIIGRALRHAIVDLLDNITNKSSEHIENETTVIGT